MRREPELIELRNRFILGIIVSLVFVIPIALLFFNRFGDERSDVLKSLNKKEDMIIFFTDSKSCDSCLEIEKSLKKNKVDYISYDISKEGDQKEVLRKLSISPTVIVPPGLVYVKEGVMSANIFDFTEETLLIFLEFHQLI